MSGSASASAAKPTAASYLRQLYHGPDTGSSTAARTQQSAAAAPTPTPTATTRLDEIIAVMDFEATCEDEAKRNSAFDLRQQEIIEWPIMLLNVRTGVIVDTLHLYLTPILQPTLTSFCTSLTGITQTMVTPSFASTQVEEDTRVPRIPAVPFHVALVQVALFFHKHRMMSAHDVHSVAALVTSMPHSPAMRKWSHAQRNESRAVLPPLDT
jgi:hypothetical protein